mmetsp:Transcript_32334/g.55963  ORF Transcript_32334/g.55963 Transcript_32334/m.55963 type:complete len:285 (-) Transcript_32334:551-1405(-)
MWSKNTFQGAIIAAKMSSLGVEADRSAEIQLQHWVETATMLLACASLLYFCEMFEWTFALLFVPVVVLEIKQVIATLLSFPKLCTIQGRYFVTCELLGFGCNLLFVTAVVIFYRQVPSLLIVTPLFFKICFRIFMRRAVKSECSSFSELLRCALAAVKFLTLSFVALKIDDQIDVSWNTTFWACWLFEAVLFVISTGVFLLFTGAVCTWAVNEAEAIEVLACAWLLFSASGATVCFAIALTEVIQYLENIDDGGSELFSPRMYFVHAYLLLFISFTVCNRSKIA